MKKYLVLIGLLLLPMSVHAASANIDLTASQSSADIGKTIVVTVNVNSSTPIGYYEYTLDYDHDKLELVNGRSYNIESADDATTKSFKKKFTFKVLKSGANKVSVKSYAVSPSGSNESMSVTVNPASINSSGEDTTNSSDNNNLKSLEIENYKLEPSFNKNTTNYVVKIEDSINEINIKAAAENSKASIIGDGKHTIKSGDNRIEITVTSESGKDKIYTIKVSLTEKDQLKITIGGSQYIVFKKLDGFTGLKNYKIKKIKIKNTTVESLYNEKTKITLIGLKDEGGKSNLYIYDADKDTYTVYNEINSDGISVMPASTTQKIKDYYTFKETINNIEVKCYKTSKSSNYCVLYGINSATGEENWYVYDLEEKTIQKYNNEAEEFYKAKMESTKVLICILSGTTLLFGILTIGFAIKSGKKENKKSLIQ